MAGRRKPAALLLAAGLALAGAPAARAQAPGIDLQGVNACQPSIEKPAPVVLVHGTYADRTITQLMLGPALQRAGYCVWAFDYGSRGMRAVDGSARELADFVEQVMAATRATKVSLVGHSQGGMLARYYVRFKGGDGKVDDVIGLVPSNHGTTTPAADAAAQYGGCVACGEQKAGSALYQALNAGDESPGDASYTQISTRYDTIVTPYTSAFLAEDFPRGVRQVTNVTVQDACPGDTFEHISIIYDPVAIQWVLSALGRPGPADPAFRPDCF